jgi:hypothetical protein
MACYKDSFSVLFVDDVRTPQETRVWASTTLLPRASHMGRKGKRR